MEPYSPIYFRIEDENGWSDSPQSRNYDAINDDWNKPIKVEDADAYIAQKIREEVNGSKKRTLFSFTRSLAVALFKYNKWMDNPLIICFSHIPENYIEYFDENNNPDSVFYSITSHLKGYPLLCQLKIKTSKIKIHNFCLAVDDNLYLDNYFRHRTDIGRKKMASPEKDEEVIMLRAPQSRYMISESLPELYIIYALHLKSGFLRDEDIRDELKEKIMQYAEDCIDKMEANSFRILIDYLAQLNINEEKSHPSILSAQKNPPMYEGEYTMALDILNAENEDNVCIPTRTKLECDIETFYSKYLDRKNSIFYYL